MIETRPRVDLKAKDVHYNKTNMFVDRLIELDQMLRKAREEAETRNDPTGTIRARVAAVAAEEEAQKKMVVDRTAKICQYLQWGYTTEQIATRLKIHPFTVKREIAHIESENNKMDRIFLGWKRKSGGYVCLTPGLPTLGSRIKAIS
jgi:DNA-binding NarL/FixJ family response regulator